MRMFWLLCSILVLISGCSKPYRSPQILPESATFVGLETVANDASAPATTLIMVHGMCHHTAEWVIESAHRFADAFGYTPEESYLTTILAGGSSGVSAYRIDLLHNTYRLAVYGIVYSPITYPIKQKALCRDATEDTLLCPHGERPEPTRAGLNADLKHTLMDECLADAIAYLGDTGRQIRLGVRDALQAIDADRGRDSRISTSPLFLLSESLGSKVLRDALLCKPDKKVEQIRTMLAYTAQVFLAANQIPLLNIGGSTADCAQTIDSRGLGDIYPGNLRTTGDFSDVLRFIEGSRAYRGLDKRIPEPIRIVSFSDPNDLLSYEIVPADYADRDAINIRVSNDFTYLGLAEHPLDAHSGYRKNDAVLELIRCGHGVPGSDACKAAAHAR